MAGTKISAQTDGGAALQSDDLPVARSGAGRKIQLNSAPNAQTGTSYAIVITDFRKHITFNNASPITVTLPQQSTLSTLAGFRFTYQNIGAGTVTFVKEGAETITGNTTAITGATGDIIRNTTTNWNIFGGTAVISEQICGGVSGAVVNQAYDISVYMPFSGTILGLDLRTTTTTVAGTFTVAISGVSVTGLTAVVPAASATRAYTSATAANTFVRGDYVTITFTGSTLVDAFWMLEYTRTY